MDPDTCWRRHPDAIWLGQEDGGLLALAVDQDQPVRLGPHGLDLWECLTETRTVPELAGLLADGRDESEIAADVHRVLMVLESVGLCISTAPDRTGTEHHDDRA